MFNPNPLGPNFNEGMIDRLLGKAYLTIKEVHDNLEVISQANTNTEDYRAVKEAVDKFDEIIKSWETGSGLMLGHDLGEVGVSDSADSVGDNVLTLLAKSTGEIDTVAENLDLLRTIYAHLNQLKAVAEALKLLLSITKYLDAITVTGENIESIRNVYNSLPVLQLVSDCSEEIKTLAENIDKFPEIIKATPDIVKISDYLTSIVTVASNIETYIEVNNRLKQAQELIENKALYTVADMKQTIQFVADKMTDIETLNSLNPRLTAAEATIKDHESRVTTNETQLKDHEERINSFETTSDIGKFSTRVSDIELKDKEQDIFIKQLQLNKLEIAVSDIAPDTETMSICTGVIYPSKNLL